MKLREVASVIVIIVVGVAALVGWAAGRFWKPDNVVEEACEEIIEDQTGVNVDLSDADTCHEEREKQVVVGECH